MSNCAAKFNNISYGKEVFKRNFYQKDLMFREEHGTWSRLEDCVKPGFLTLAFYVIMLQRSPYVINNYDPDSRQIQRIHL
jgi:hypothetical protein